MSPSHIEFLLHCYYSPQKHHRIDAPAIQEAIEEFLKDDLIEIEVGEPEIYSTTDRGKAHVRQLCKLPLPTAKWVSFTGSVI
jgi:hypothetical protein